MKRYISLTLITFVLTTILLVLAGCGGGSGGSSINPGPIVVPTSTPTLAPNPTATPGTPPATPNIGDPTPTPVYVTDPNEFGPVDTGKCHVNVVTYYIDTSNKEKGLEQVKNLTLLKMGKISEEGKKELLASGVLKVYPNINFKIYDGSTVAYSGHTGDDGDCHIENFEPGTYKIVGDSVDYPEEEVNTTFEGGYINIVSLVFNGPTD